MIEDPADVIEEVGVLTTDVIEDDVLVTIDDIRRRHCVAGARRWFAAKGLDFRTVIRQGVPASVLLATGDAFARQVVDDVIRRRESSDGR